MTSSSLRSRIIATFFRKAIHAAGRRRSRLELHTLEQRVTPTVTYPDIIMQRPSNDPLTNAALIPAGFDAFTPPISSEVDINPGAPTIAEWTRTAGPDQTIALTGDALSSFSGDEF